MNITEIRIRHQSEDSKLRAMVSVTFDGVFAVHDIKIIEGTHRLFLAMPSRKMMDGRFRDIVHPIGEEMRHMLETKVLEHYHITRENIIAHNTNNGLPPILIKKDFENDGQVENGVNSGINFDTGVDTEVE